MLVLNRSSRRRAGGYGIYNCASQHVFTTGVQELGQQVESLCDQGLLDRALEAVRLHIQELGATSIPFRACFSLLKATSYAKSLQHAFAIHALFSGKERHLAGALGDQLVATFGQCGDVDVAHRVLLSLHRRSIFTWRALISGFVACGRAHEALEAYKSMQDESIEPDQYTFVSLIRACTLLEDLHKAEKLHCDATKKGFIEDAFIGTVLIRMYGKCGSIMEAENVFINLCGRTIVSWGALLSVYLEHRQPTEVLQLYVQMQGESIDLDQHMFVMLLQACIQVSEIGDELNKKAALEIGQGLHTAARRRGLARDIFVGCALITMYGKCKHTLQAENVFDTLIDHTVVAWSSLMSAYVDQGQPEMALCVYRQMQDEGVASDMQTFLITLPACGFLAGKEKDGGAVSCMACLEIGSALHADAQLSGFTSYVCVRNSVLSMYGKCGNIKEAESVFVGMPDRDYVSWNAMISTYVDQRQGYSALRLYRQMREEGFYPVQQTFLVIPQACGLLACGHELVIEEKHPVQLGSLEIGKALHADALRSGFLNDTSVTNSFVSMYGKCGTNLEAENLFVELHKPDLVSWNALLSACVEDGQGGKALQLYVQLQKEGFSPSQQTSAIALQACGNLAGNLNAMDGEYLQLQFLEIGRALHHDALIKHNNLDNCLKSAIVCIYGKCKSIREAEIMFLVLLEGSVMVWNSMLSAYVAVAQSKNALYLYNQMLQEGVAPGEQTFVYALQACGVQGELNAKGGQLDKMICFEIGQALHDDARVRGLVSDQFVASALVCMYGRCGSLVEAESVFSGLVEHNTVSWNAMLSVYLELGNAEKALRLYLQMKECKVILDDVTLSCALAACKATGSMDICMLIHFDVVAAGYDSDIDIMRTIIRTYGDCSYMVDAQVVFDRLPLHDVISWTTYIAGFAQDGNCESCLHAFKAMERAGITPNECTFLTVLTACTRAGLVDHGIELFESMHRDYGVIPNLKHFTTLIDLLGRTGEFKKLEHILAKMPIQANWSFWMCVLDSCHTYGQVELGKEAFDNAVSLKPKVASAYILMSKIYADAGLHECAKEVERLHIIGVSQLEEYESEYAF